MTELPPETVNAAASRVNGILNQGANSATATSGHIEEVANGRKKRSDAGKPRAPKPSAPEGCLSKIQADTLNRLYGAVGEARLELEDVEQALKKAGAAFNAAEAAYFNYIAEITAK